MLDASTEFAPGITFKEVYGHTEAMVLPLVSYKNQKVLFMADLIPSAAHLPLPYVMAYDVRPLETMKEKISILNEAAAQNWTLFFEHDPNIECISLEATEKGVKMKEQFKLNEI